MCRTTAIRSNNVALKPIHLKYVAQELLPPRAHAAALLSTKKRGGGSGGRWMRGNAMLSNSKEQPRDGHIMANHGGGHGGRGEGRLRRKQVHGAAQREEASVQQWAR